MSTTKKPVQASLSKKFVAYVREHPYQYPDADAFFASLDEWPEKAVRTNTLVTNIEDLCVVWERQVEKVPWCNDATYFSYDEKIGSTLEHENGLCYVGDPAAMLAIETIDIAADAFVVDMCAAPGGKSIHALNSLGPNGTLIANDIDVRRAKILQENLERMVALVPAALQPHIEVTTLSAQDLADKYENCADVVILDAPCSGEAMMRRSNTARRQWSEKLLLKMSVLQKFLLSYATVLLKPGGSIVYSTCTFNEIENENVVKFGCDELGLINIDINCEPPLVKRELGVAIYPHLARGDGQFVAVLRK